MHEAELYQILLILIKNSCGSLLGHESQLILSGNNLQEYAIIQLTKELQFRIPVDGPF